MSRPHHSDPRVLSGETHVARNQPQYQPSDGSDARPQPEIRNDSSSVFDCFSNKAVFLKVGVFLAVI